MAFASVRISKEKLRRLFDNGYRNKAMVCRELGITTGAMWNYLRGEGNVGVKPEIFEGMLRVFGVTADELRADDTGESQKTRTIRVSAETYAALERQAAGFNPPISIERLLARFAGLDLEADLSSLSRETSASSGAAPKGASREDHRTAEVQQQK